MPTDSEKSERSAGFDPLGGSEGLPAGYTCEPWQWGGWMTWQEGFATLYAMERGATREEAIGKLNARLKKISEGWERELTNGGRVVWHPPNDQAQRPGDQNA